MKTELTERKQMLIAKAKEVDEYIDAYFDASLPKEMCINELYSFVLDNDVTHEDLNSLGSHLDFITVIALRQALKAIEECDGEGETYETLGG